MKETIGLGSENSSNDGKLLDHDAHSQEESNNMSNEEEMRPYDSNKEQESK